MSLKFVDDLVLFSHNQPEFEETLTPSSKCIKGRPVQRSWHHFTNEDEKFFAGVWEAEPGCWSINYTEDEFCQIVSGRSILRDLQGKEQTVEAGDNFVIPAGFQGHWEVLETTRKIYVVYQSC